MSRSYAEKYGVDDTAEAPGTVVTDAEVDSGDSTEELKLRRSRAAPSCIFIPKDGRPFARFYAYLSAVDWYDDETILAAFPGGMVTIEGNDLDMVFLALAEHRAHTIKALGKSITSIKWEPLQPATKGGASEAGSARRGQT